MIIRPLAAADAAEFRRLRLEALERHPEAFRESHAEAARLDVAAVAARLAAMVPPDAVFGVFTDDAMVGLTGFAVEPRAKVRHKGRVWGVYVTAAARGGACRPCPARGHDREPRGAPPLRGGGLCAVRRRAGRAARRRALL
jgi:hypothetical protein